MPLISDEVIQQIIDRADIVEIVSSYVPLKKTGRSFKALSPFKHEKTPSFVVSPDKQIFHCFSSGIGGNVISFVMRMERMDFPEAIRFLAKKVGVDIPEDRKENAPAQNFRQQLYDVNDLAVKYFNEILLTDKSAEAKTAREYLKNRGLSLETVQKFQMGLALDKWDGLMQYLQNKKISLRLLEKAGLIIPHEKADGYYDRFRGRIIFPIFDTRGNCRAFGGRTLQKDNSAKYINSPETDIYTKGHHLYGFDLAKEHIAQEDFVIIVEGYLDCVIPFQAGVGNVVASLGTALTVEQIRLLRRYTKNVVMLFDSDSAGIAAMIRSLDILIEEDVVVKIAGLAEGEDPDSFIRKYGVEAFRQRIKEAKSIFDYKLEFLVKQFDVSTVEGKARISGDMLQTIQKFPNAVAKAGYLGRLSAFLGIPEFALREELKKLELQSDKDRSRGDEESPLREDKVRSVEHNILRLLLEETDFIAVTKDQVVLEDFQDHKVRSVVSKIFDLFDQGKTVSPTGLISSFDDIEMQKMISGLIAQEETLVGDKEKIHRDCISRLKKDRQKSYRQKLLEKIRAAESAGDHQQLESLRVEFNNTIKEVYGRKNEKG